MTEYTKIGGVKLEVLNGETRWPYPTDVRLARWDGANDDRFDGEAALEAAIVSEWSDK